MKKFLLSVCIILSISLVVIGCASYTEHTVLSRNLYINDKYAEWNVYENKATSCTDGVKDFIPFEDTLKALGCDFEEKDDTNYVVKIDEKNSM